MKTDVTVMDHVSEHGVSNFVAIGGTMTSLLVGGLFAMFPPRDWHYGAGDSIAIGLIIQGLSVILICCKYHLEER